MHTKEALALVDAERDRQRMLVRVGQIKYPLENRGLHVGTKLAVLTEEVGEVARAICDQENIIRLREELVQVAAVAVAWIEATL